MTEPRKWTEEDEKNYQERLTWNRGDLCEFLRPDPVTGEMKPIPGLEDEGKMPEEKTMSWSIQG